MVRTGSRKYWLNPNRSRTRRSKASTPLRTPAGPKASTPTSYITNSGVTNSKLAKGCRDSVQ